MGWGAPCHALPMPASTRILIGPQRLEGDFVEPAPACGLVVFAHGSGSSRHSRRNQEVAEALQRLGLGTLLFDLLTPEEAAIRAHVFDIELLTSRLLLSPRVQDPERCQQGQQPDPVGPGRRG